MAGQEYLVSFGLTGEFGRFHARTPLALRRGERVVVRSARGVEIGEVLRSATPRHANFLPNTTVGQLLRRLTPADAETAGAMDLRRQQLFERAQELLAELGLPLILLDVEMLFDGEHAVLHQVREGECDVRPFVSTLSREFAVHLILVDLSGDREAAGTEEHAGCGRPDCGQGGEGGCGTCGSGGCGTCGSAKPHDMELYFAQLREQMERQRTALL